MPEYIIRLNDGSTIEIDGEPCLQEEYPNLQLFLGFYPCDDLGKCKNSDDCVNNYLDHGCYCYKVNETRTGASFYPHFYGTKESAIQATKWIIERVGIDNVKQIIERTLLKFNN